MSSFNHDLPGESNIPPDSFDPSRDSAMSQASSGTQREYRAISPATAEYLGLRGKQAATILTSTPKNKHSTRDNAAGESLPNLTQSIVRLLGDMPIASADWLVRQLTSCKIPSHTLVGRWIHSKVKEAAHTKAKPGVKALGGATGAIFADGRWTSIPETSKDLMEAKLYKPFVKLINAALTKFNVRGREVVDNHGKYLGHQDEGHRTAPDLVICASGPSFEAPSNGRASGYSNMVTFIELKLDEKLGREGHKEQLVGYVRYVPCSLYILSTDPGSCRQIFAQQPNRWFVRCAILSENRIRVYQFDRAGAQTTQTFDIHAGPERFIRIILLLCTDKDDRHLGLDDTLRWEMDGKGKKKRGFMRTRALDRVKELVLLNVNPVACHRHIRGSATTLWAAYDPDTMVEYLVKVSWISEGRTPEWMLLQKAAENHVKGVCRMAWYEECLLSVNSIRCEETTDLFFNRIQFRIVMEKYGEEIEGFTSVLQVLEALRDAIAGEWTPSPSSGIPHRF
jgi:hypothetical protein